MAVVLLQRVTTVPGEPERWELARDARRRTLVTLQQGLFNAQIEDDLVAAYLQIPAAWVERFVGANHWLPVSCIRTRPRGDTGRQQRFYVDNHISAANCLTGASDRETAEFVRGIRNRNRALDPDRAPAPQQTPSAPLSPEALQRLLNAQDTLAFIFGAREDQDTHEPEQKLEEAVKPSAPAPPTNWRRRSIRFRK